MVSLYSKSRSCGVFKMSGIEHQLVRGGKMIMRSKRKLDVVFAHQRYSRRDGVTYREVRV